MQARERERQEERLSLLEDEDPDPKTSGTRHQQLGEREREVPGRPMVQHREVKKEA